jgi:hypothetical protein
MGFRRDKRALIILAAAALFLGGCSFFGGINSAEKLAAAFRGKGITYHTATKVPVKSNKNVRTGEVLKVNEALDLKGQDFFAEIVRINDKRSYEKFKPALEMSLAMIEMGYKKPRSSIVAYLKYPFIIIVIEEPASGDVYNALKKIFPNEPITEVVASEEGYKLIEQLKSQIQTMFQ